MKNKLIYIILFCMLFEFSCSIKSNETVFQGKIPVTEIKVTPPIEKHDKRFCEFDKIYVVPLETNEESIFGTHSKIHICADRIYILDTYNAKGLFVFDMDGKYLFKIDQKGNGPGEFFTANDFFVDTVKSTIAIFDVNKRNLHYYDWQGKHTQTRRIEYWPNACYPFDSQILALSFTMYYDGSNPFELKLLDEDNNNLFNFKPLYVNHSFPNNSSIAFYEGINAVYYTPVLCDTFYVVNPMGIEHAYYINFGKYAIPQGFIGDYSDPLSLNNKLLGSKYCYRIKNIVETSDLLSFQYNYSNTGRFAVYNKKTGNVIYNSINYLYYPGIEASYGDYMVGIQESSLIVESVSNPNEWKEAIGEKNFEILKNVKDTDNSVIYFYKLQM